MDRKLKQLSKTNETFTAVQTWWEQCKEWMEYFKGHSVPGVPDQQSRLQVLRGKEEVARTEVETFMEHCAKRWQTKEGTRNGKRRHDGHLKTTRMAWRITTWWKRSHEGLRGARRFTFVSHLFAKFHRTLCVGFCLFGGLRFVLVCVGLFCLWDGLVNFLHSIGLWKQSC